MQSIDWPNSSLSLTTAILDNLRNFHIQEERRLTKCCFFVRFSAKQVELISILACILAIIIKNEELLWMQKNVVLM